MSEEADVTWIEYVQTYIEEHGTLNMDDGEKLSCVKALIPFSNFEDFRELLRKLTGEHDHIGQDIIDKQLKENK